MALPEKCTLCNADIAHQEVVTAHVYGSEASLKRAFFHCNFCDVIYQYPGLTAEEEAKFYSAEFEKFMTSRSGDAGGWLKANEHINANELTRVRRMKYLKPYLDEVKNILEVGCSSGFMLLPLVEDGYNCTGVEPSGIFRDFVASKGIDVHASLKDMTRSPITSQYDLIMHFFVLEHIANPIEFLLSQLEILKPGGRIVFEIPNTADALYSVYDIPQFERFYWSIAHPWYFNEASLNYLLEKVGQPFEILRDQRYDLSNHMVWARDGKPGGMSRFTENLGLELEEIYKKELIRIGKCDTLVGVIQKSH